MKQRESFKNQKKEEQRKKEFRIDSSKLSDNTKTSVEQKIIISGDKSKT
jgi:hypothetical protein